MKKLLSLLLIFVTSVQAQGIGVSFGPGPGLSVSAGSGGTAPTIQTTATGTGASTGTSATVNLPASIAIGDLILLFAVVSNGTSGTPTATGYTCTTANTGSSGDLIWCYRTADGTEGTTIVLSWTSTSRNIVASMRISGQAAANPEASTPTTTGIATTTPDGGNNLTPSWGFKNNLWLSFIGVPQNTAGTFTSPPSSYTNSITEGVLSQGGLGVSYRQLSATAENPGTWTTNSANWSGVTLAIKGI